MSEFEDLFAGWGRDGNGVPLPGSVQTKLGDGANGPKFSASLDQPGLIQLPQNRLVRTSTGDEVVSSTLVYVPLELREHFTLGSRVTLADGRTAAILTIASPDVYGLFGFLVLNLE